MKKFYQGRLKGAYLKAPHFPAEDYFAPLLLITLQSAWISHPLFRGAFIPIS
jgi:hypothetical protein